MVFTADHRNIGGRDQIIERIQNHHTNLTKIKSSINTRIKPKKHVDHTKSVRKSKSSKFQFASQYQDMLQNILKLKLTL